MLRRKKLSLFMFSVVSALLLLLNPLSEKVIAAVTKNWEVNGQYSLFNAGVGPYDVGITQGLLGGPATMEFTTADFTGKQTTRMILRGNSTAADVEFYSGNKGSETLTMFIEGTNGNVGIGVNSPNTKLDVNGDISARNSGVVSVGNNNLAGMNFGFAGEQANIRLGGDGPGAWNGLAIRQVGNATLLKIDETSGTVKLTSDYPTICIGKC